MTPLVCTLIEGLESRKLQGLRSNYPEGAVDFIEVTSVWKFPYCILPKQTLQDGKKQPKDKVFGHDFRDPHVRISLAPPPGCPAQKLYAMRLCCCFRQRMAGMSRDWGRDEPGLEKVYARDIENKRAVLQKGGLANVPSFRFFCTVVSVSQCSAAV